MPVVVSHKDVVQQSLQVFGQFGESKWIPFAKENANLERRPTDELKNIGVGKFLICAAMGESLEESVGLIQKNRDRVEVLTCDKGFGALLDHGIKADYVMLCDCNILPKWIDPYIEETRGVKLISTVYANVSWTTRWKGPRYFYVNKDAIQTEKIFSAIFNNDVRVIPASTNVSNAMVVFFTGCDEISNTNWAGYEKYLLTGYDYSWRPNGNYYAWSNPLPKRNYMHHRTMLDMNNDWCFTSENLFFSAKWLYSYLTTFNMPVVNCSNRGMLLTPTRGNLERELKAIRQDKSASRIVQILFDNARKSFESFETARKSFDKAREELYQCQ